MFGKDYPSFSYEEESPCIEKAGVIIDCFLAINVRKLQPNETTLVIPPNIVELVEEEIIGVLAGFMEAFENNQRPDLESDETREFFDYLICSKSEFWGNPIIFILDKLMDSHLLVSYKTLKEGAVEVDVAQWFIDYQQSGKVLIDVFPDEDEESTEE